MHLNITNPAANMIGENFGIPEERQNEISRSLDLLSKDLDDRPGINTLEVLATVAKPCDTVEEFIYALLNHIKWLRLRGYRFEF